MADERATDEQPDTGHRGERPDPADDDAPAAEAVARALSSPLRMRILRLCAFDARTNKELAELLDLNPGTVLHHVRTLVDVDMLAPQEPRTGRRGAKEIPYKATGRSWHSRVPGMSIVLLETMRQQLAGVDPDEVATTWMGLRLNAAHKAELDQRLYGLIQEFKERGPDPDGDAWSLVTVLHPDRNPAGPPA
ncbi:winged helix-turn-helix transcriptional regulator [Miniimonas arenae]|uniref:Winged helix-turn-helix transcriptional regulator n=1 Tax=Miniimonas arenae TaxID=676201 RepID=A0A5C5BBW4_9MICO|nr:MULTISPECIES: winged helix-turn-helix domain-containing protein [Miniimonas]TNU74058.1 winged helix-turn-helix transcriptional regulator [Miniimonas arenae]